MISRYPSPAELDAFAQKTASSPLSIRIFPSDVRVPQHKQLNRTVNGLDTTGQRYSPYPHPHSGGYQGLLGIVKASVVAKGVVKTSEGRKTKHANCHTSVAPYHNPLNNSYKVRHGHEAYRMISSCEPPDVPVKTLCSAAGTASGDPSLAPQNELAEVQSLMRQMSRVPYSQVLQPGGAARASPSLQAVAAVAHTGSGFVFGVPPPSSLAFAGAVLPAQGANTATVGYLERGGYAAWQHKAPTQQQPYQQEAGGVYGVGQSPETGLPLPGSSRPSYRQHSGGVGAGPGRGGVPGEHPVGQFFAPLWDEPSSDCYASQVLGPCTTRLGEVRHLQPQLPPPLPFHAPRPPHPHPQAYAAEQSVCCGLPGLSLCHAAALSSSLQSLECLISDIHPPCIKERMLGRGYDAVGLPQLLEHQQHIQLPVYR